MRPVRNRPPAVLLTASDRGLAVVGYAAGRLAAHCAGTGRGECLVVSAPINLAGGVGSPANAVALT